MHFTDAIVLRKTLIGEADALVTLYTQHFGKLSGRATGIYKEAAKLKGHLETISLTTVGFISGKSGERIIHAEMIEYWPRIRNDAARLGAAHYIRDLMERYLEKGDPDSDLWRIAVSALQDLETGDFPPEISRSFADGFARRFSAALGWAEPDDLLIFGAPVAKPF
ncbi:MAG: DNA repair protein RecO [Patescibacteria group bacterium]